MTLKPWREIATPHPDVAAGRYRQAEFAADLAQVLSAGVVKVVGTGQVTVNYCPSGA